MSPQTRGGRYAGKTAAERDLERRERLLDAGLATFGSVGLGQSAIETLCSDARVATREFYNLFATKERLLLAVDDRIVDEAAAAIDKALTEVADDPATRIRSGLRAYATTFTSDPLKARVHFFEVLAVSTDAAPHRRLTGARLMGTFLAEAERYMEAGIVPRRDTAITGVALLGATRYAMTDWAISPSRHTPDDVIDELTRIFLATMTQPDDAAG